METYSALLFPDPGSWALVLVFLLVGGLCSSALFSVSIRDFLLLMSACGKELHVHSSIVVSAL